MSLEGSRLVGLLLVWLAVGFAFQAATTGLGDDLAAEVMPEAATSSGQGLLVPSLVGASTLTGLTGTLLLVRDPGPGRMPGVALGRAETREAPNRCYRCRKPWPTGADACPHCGAKRLQEPPGVGQQRDRE